MPEKDTTKQYKPKKLDIITVYTDEKTLRSASKPVDLEEIKTPEFQHFLDDMLHTLKTHKMKEGWMAVGLAAVQVNNPIAVFIAYNYEDEQYHFYINAQVDPAGESQNLETEGCLSIPDREGKVRRYKKVKVRYYDRNGEKKSVKLEHWSARLVQHENDHTLGILFTDKIVG